MNTTGALSVRKSIQEPQDDYTTQQSRHPNNAESDKPLRTRG
jgi:hypothetical protein